VVSREKRPFDADATVISDHSVLSPTLSGPKATRLEQTRGPGAPRELRLLADETVIGRSHQAALCIESGLLSRRHALFKKNGPELCLLDLESANGVYVNGVRIHSVILCDGDTIQIGDVVLVVREGA